MQATSFVRRTVIILLATGVSAVGSARTAHAQAGRTVISVKDSHVVGPTIYPAAAGDGITDDTLAIQGAIYYATASPANRSSKGALVYFPEGDYLVKSTLQVPNSGGLDFAGASANAYISQTTGKLAEFDPIHSAIIEADFNTSDENGSVPPVILSEGSWSRWIDLVLVARAKPTSLTPSALFQTTSPPGFCTNNIVFDNVFFFNSLTPSDPTVSGIALAFGINDLDQCNAEFVLKRCAFTRFQTCVRVNTPQGIDHLFQDVGAVACRTFLDLAQGGNVSFDTGTFTACGGTGPEDWIFKLGLGGPNVGQVRVNNAHFEMNCKQLVRCNGIQHAIFENLSENAPGTSTAPLEVDAGSTTFSDCLLSSFPILKIGSPTLGTDATARLRDCSFPVVAIGVTTPPHPSIPQTLPAGLIVGVAGQPLGKYVIQHCTGIYSDLLYFPVANATNVSRW